MAMNNNDTLIKDALKEITECLMEQKCFHKSFASAADWLNLRGEKRCHEYKMFMFMCLLRKLDRFQINVLGMHIDDDMQIQKINVVQNNFYNSKRIDSNDENSIRNFLKNSTEMWLKLEEENLDFYTKLWASLISAGTVSSIELGCFVKCLLDDTVKKVKYISRKLMDYRSTNYNILQIMESQESKHDHYREKMHKIKDMLDK